jgi:hypothetical protein
MTARAINFLIIAVIAAIATWLATFSGLTAWVIFLSWLSYFVFGTTTKAATFATAQILVGLFVGVGILLFTAQLAPQLGDFALGTAVAFFAGLLTLLEDRPPFNVIPAYYIGAVTMFASGLPPTLTSVVQLAVPILVGFGFGWLTVTVRAAADRAREAQAPAGAHALDS